MFKRISEKCSVIQCSSVSVFIHKGKGKDTKQDKDIGKDKGKNKDKLFRIQSSSDAMSGCS